MTNDEEIQTQDNVVDYPTPEFQFVGIVIAALRPERLTAACSRVRRWAAEDDGEDAHMTTSITTVTSRRP